MKVDILSRKDQVNTQDDNKDIQMLKEKLWNRRTMEEIIMAKTKQHTRENGFDKGDTIQWNQGTRSNIEIEERRWTSLGK